MSKIAEYLQEHILGEVTTNPAILSAMSRDGSVLEIKPDIVVYPRVTNDIRKVTRFAWQLAEKGHALSLTPRGSGTDDTGAAIGSGVIIETRAHMNAMLEFDQKQKLIRVQPGVSTASLNDALVLHGLSIPSLPLWSSYGTIGGAVASNAGGMLAGRYGTTGNWVQQLEVVLANGDILQTERLNKRDLNKRKGMQTFEGEIYRSLDNLIEDNKQLIEEKIASDVYDGVGYNSIADVKKRDGSFDLTPLIIGSQGTLGIISEMIMKSDFVSLHSAVAVAGFTTREKARDMLDDLRKLEPAYLEYYDGEFFDIAARQGKTYEFNHSSEGMLGAVVVLGFNDFSDHARKKQLKRLEKLLSGADAVYQAADGADADRLAAVRDVTAYALLPPSSGVAAVPLFDNAYIPPERFEEFCEAVSTLASKHHVTLPLHFKALASIVSARPTLQLHKVSDKQKVFKLLDEYAALVSYYNGHLIAVGGEGRLKARFAYGQLDDDVKELYAAVKAIFDPYTILNTGVKQSSEVRQLAGQLRGDYDMGKFAAHPPYL